MSLYHISDSKDNCGFGLIAHIEGEASHNLVSTAIQGLDRMQHRGGVASDGKTGDGCGLLLQKPDAFFRKVASDHDWTLNENYAVGMIFLSQDPFKTNAAKKLLNQELENEMLTVVGWREVPTDNSILGDLAKSGVPRIEQIFVNGPSGWSLPDLERRLYMARRRVEKLLVDDEDFYVACLSTFVTIYKGLVMPRDLPAFYTDLADPDLASSICVFHQRFSTNTFNLRAFYEFNSMHMEPWDGPAGIVLTNGHKKT